MANRTSAGFTSIRMKKTYIKANISLEEAGAMLAIAQTISYRDIATVFRQYPAPQLSPIFDFKSLLVDG